jgi:membrane protein
VVERTGTVGAIGSWANDAATRRPGDPRRGEVSDALHHPVDDAAPVTERPAEQAAEPADAVARGAQADNPAEFSRRAWLEILRRVWAKTGKHNIGFLAAGVAFYGFLSLAPGLGLVVMIYGLIADPQTIFDHMVGIVRLVPAEAAMLINDQLSNLITTAASTHGLATIPAVLIALYGASGAANGIVTSLNIIYEQDEKRNLFKLMAISIAIAAATVFVVILGLLSVSALALIKTITADLGTPMVIALRLVTWLVTGGLASLTLAMIYRFGPCRADAKWRWLSLGSLVATVLWLVISLLFGWYVSVAHYNTTYGSLGTVVALIMWMYLSAYAMLLGAFLDAEAERQTARDSTTGTPLPLGRRGAVVADTSAALEAD